MTEKLTEKLPSTDHPIRFDPPADLAAAANVTAEAYARADSDLEGF